MRLRNDLLKLIAAAKKAAKYSYSPYSRFPVGAAVLTMDGSLFSACNVENASFGLTMCAERNAVFQAVANGKPCINAIAIYTPTLQPTTPCGACRQVISEFGAHAQIVSTCAGKDIKVRTIEYYLPSGFRSEGISRNSGKRKTSRTATKTSSKQEKKGKHSGQPSIGSISDQEG